MSLRALSRTLGLAKTLNSARTMSMGPSPANFGTAAGTHKASNPALEYVTTNAGSAPAGQKASNPALEYVTDIEGNYRFWQSFLNASRVVARDERGLFVRPGAAFVFGGDAIDRGGASDSEGDADLRVLEDLVSLKKRCPDQVDLIIGNRDANKLRLPIELHASILQQAPRVFWVANNANGAAGDTAARRLKDFTLPQTMGAPVAFEARQKELKKRGLNHSDDDVAASYLDSLKPGGLLLEYLSLAQLISIRGDIAFVHGAITSSNLFFVPPPAGASETNKGTEVRDLHGWAEALNAFARKEVSSFATDMPEYAGRADVTPWSWVGGYHHAQPGSRLVQYCNGRLPDGTDARSVIYSSVVKSGKPEPLDETVAAALRDAGVRYLIVGHQPYADSPYVIQADQLLLAGLDTSYAANVARPAANTARPSPEDPSGFCAIDPETLRDVLDREPIPPKENTRGIAYAIASFYHERDRSGSCLILRGRLADGATYECDAVCGGSLGSQTEDGWIMTLDNVTMPDGKKARYFTKGIGYDFQGRYEDRL